MKRIILQSAAVVLLSTLNLQLSTAFAQGSLTPPGAPAPTMKTLAQIEPRTPISSGPYTISSPGSYYLTTNITVSGGNAITIATNGVTLDLGGFTISSTAVSANGYGILMTNSKARNLTILNGFIEGGVTNNGSGTYSGSGFLTGIYYSVNAPVNTRVSGVSVAGCLYDGIYLGNGDSTLVEACTVRTAGGYGIVASTIKSSLTKDCGITGIYGDQVSDSRGESTGSSPGISAATALNCYGVSVSGQGISAVNVSNCRGSSHSSQGIYAETASNCYGNSDLNRGLFANIATACSGSCGGGSYGVFATSIANTCYGSSASGTGLSAYIAIGCTGSSVGYTYHYNMPP
jgi:hypothetical protein